MTHCGNCRFWSRHGSGEHGWCARYPPIVVVRSGLAGDEFHTRWPEPHASDGCGEHEMTAAAPSSQPDGHA